MLEETGYLSQGSEEVCGVSALRASQASAIYQFCMFFRLYCTLFMVFSAESIRSEYVGHRSKRPAVTVKHSSGFNARLGDLEVSIWCCGFLDYIIYLLCSCRDRNNDLFAGLCRMCVL
jgi:hypothetical protein